MKKKIGFIDNFIDEWHSNNYPAMIAASPLGDAFELGCAWEVAPHPERRPLAQWCRDNGMIAAASREEVVEQSDCIVVLAPNNSELHEALAAEALRSGKPVYVDKAFAPDRATAERMFALAAKHRTPLMSSSALRYADALGDALRTVPKGERVNFAAAFGNGLSFEFYGIHQLEMLVMALGTGAVRVLMLPGGRNRTLLIDYGDGRIGEANFAPGLNFRVLGQYGADGGWDTGDLGFGYFQKFVDAMLAFLLSGESQVPQAETLENITLLETARRAEASPGIWIPVDAALRLHVMG